MSKTFTLVKQNEMKILFCDKVIVVKRYCELVKQEVVSHFNLVRVNKNVEEHTIIPVTEKGIEYENEIWNDWGCNSSEEENCYEDDCDEDDIDWDDNDYYCESGTHDEYFNDWEGR